MDKISTIQDYKMGSPQTQTFVYDDIYKLTSAQAPAGRKVITVRRATPTTRPPVTCLAVEESGASTTHPTKYWLRWVKP